MIRFFASGFTFIAKIVIYDQERINDGSNYEYPGQSCGYERRFTLLLKTFISFKTGSTSKCRNSLDFDFTALIYLLTPFFIPLHYI